LFRVPASINHDIFELLQSGVSDRAMTHISPICQDEQERL